MEKPKRVFEGLNLLMRTYGAKRGIIAVKEDKKGLIELLNMYNKRYADSKIEIMGVGNYYPQGYEKEVIKNIMGLNIPPGVLPSKHGIMVFNVTTAAAVYLAIKYNMPVTKRYFTVTGDAVKYPSNFRVRIGAELKNMIDQVGGYTTEDRVIILGGPMMGASLTNDNIIVSKTSTSVIVLKDEQVAEEACVRCSSCVYSCPMELQPVLLMNASKARNKDALKKMNVLNCIECGLCTYTCTSKIHVTEWMRRGKRLAKL
jgi:electron transport complex protein RnfC